jgi:hypothetical protein
MVEALEDYALYVEAEKRMKSSESEGFISSEELYKELNINEEDINVLDVEIE